MFLEEGTLFELETLLEVMDVIWGEGHHLGEGPFLRQGTLPLEENGR